MCSPTRAALLTGVNPHRAGAGHVANSDPGFPGLRRRAGRRRRHRWPRSSATPATPRSRSASGTSPRTPTCPTPAPSHSWPLPARASTATTAFLDAFTNLHHPHRLVEDNHTVEVDQYPDGYYLTDDLTDRAHRHDRARSKASNPRQPFLCYFAHGAVHAPLHCKASDLARHRGPLRRRLGRDPRGPPPSASSSSGLLPPGTELPPRNTEDGRRRRRRGTTSPPEDQAPVRPVHGGVRGDGRQRRPERRPPATPALDELGVLDNTIFVFLSDNGASREGEDARHHRRTSARSSRRT